MNAEAGATGPLSPSEHLKRWRASDGEKTIGGLVDEVGTGGFGLIFIVLMGVPALPLPTGGITHVLEIVAMLLALQLIVGRATVWVPERWRGVQFEDGPGARFIDGLIRTITKLERFSKPRARWMFGRWWSRVSYGVAALAGSLAAFFAPPFSGLDTVPALGLIILSVGVIMEDIVYVIAGFLMILAGPVLTITVGTAIFDWLKGLI